MLSNQQEKVLRCLKLIDAIEVGSVMYFSGIARRTKLNKRQVRLACRALARKGFAEHIRGLMFDGGPKDGMFCGSGYGITRAGRYVPCKARKAVGS